IHTKKICDACIDKDCIEDLRVYLTRESQGILDCATNAKARCAELLHVGLDVETVPFSCGHYSVDITFYYRILADVIVGGTRPTTISGLAVFSKRVILCGGEGNTKIFSSKIGDSIDQRTMMTCNKPDAIVEVVDPMILSSKVVDVCNCCRTDCDLVDLPASICGCFDSELVLSGETKRLYVTVGQFSIIRIERDTQLLIPTYDYCIPKKDCSCSGGNEEDPCELFSKVQFPLRSFFPVGCDNTCSNQYTTCG
ncbi:MAG: hypothetical protein R3Y62_08975, partial [Eubacteriales bacterium]